MIDELYQSGAVGLLGVMESWREVYELPQEGWVGRYAGDEEGADGDGEGVSCRSLGEGWRNVKGDGGREDFLFL